MKILSSVLLLILSSACVAQTSTANSYESLPEFQKLRAQAKDEQRSNTKIIFAAGTWKKANKVAGGHCMECLEGVFTSQLRLGEYKDALKTAKEWDAASEQPLDHVRAELAEGRVAIAMVDRNKPNMAVLQDAHVELQKAAAAHATAAYFYDGQVLALMKQDADAGAAFGQYAKLTRKDDALLSRATYFSTHPEMAREKMAPAVLVNTLGGKRFNLDDMHGRVVLIDFWATWCGPCKEELPHMKKLAEAYKDEPLEIISISWDSDANKWRQFIADNGMSWNQYLDADHSVTKMFGIDAIPHYFTIDANGVLMAENVGSGSNIDGRIRKLVTQAKEQKQLAAAAGALTAGQ
ncbi:TlpA family protein disulfide reductase [Terriglobus roseus]|uniref:Thiol-disulfide isomerase or thioredoxin n=1 Tax=Terriglobus roseus TaxID=392734 RepID=A0A1G7R146_9BACT|nr:TlpA disulfide reductase family protein [Terriglobus roseus]SDG04455.1 Thiol-disulfide isomerase or thioredoxin [Terriglobus roseus]